MMMQGNGGIVRPEEMTGGRHSAVGAGRRHDRHRNIVAGKLGHDNVITTDMGGTSFDVGLLTLGTLHYAREPIVEAARLLQPMIEVESIGAGGGTIARVDPVTGRLLVGPASAGADPGPVAYGMGGKAVTVTDANIVLGYIDPDYFLGGRRKLRQSGGRARHPTPRLPTRSGSRTIEAAAGIYDVINSKMSDLIRKQVVRVGQHPRRLRDVCFRRRRSGPCRGLRRRPGRQEDLHLPDEPGLFGIRRGHRRRHPHHAADQPCSRRRSTWRRSTANLLAIRENLGRVMAREGFAPADVTYRRTLYMRYTRQTNDVELQIPDRRAEPQGFAGNRAHVQPALRGPLRSRRDPHAQPASRSSRSASMPIGSTPKPQLTRQDLAGSDASAARKGTRRAFFTGASRGFKEAVDLRFRPAPPRQSAARAGDHRDAVHHRRRARDHRGRDRRIRATSFCCHGWRLEEVLDA